MTLNLRGLALVVRDIGARFLHSRAVRVVAALSAVAVLGAMLIATIYWTLFDPKWIAFLGGVLFAALLAAASRASTVEWRLARRTQQLEKLRGKYVQEKNRAQAAIAALRAAEERLQALCELQPAPVVRDGDPVKGAGAEEHGVELTYLKSLSGNPAEWDEPHIKLSQALEENQFLLLAQPIAALGSGAPQAPFFEIFLRLKEEEEYLLPPGSFFPVAERYGMMEDLDRWVVRELITRRHERRQQPGPATYCVNLSQASVRSHAFARFVQKQILDRDFDGKDLCFEIAEADIAACHADVARLIAMLKPLGCRFTVDAFGSVKGCFSTLKGLAFDFVKIDGVVTQNIVRHPAELAKVHAIVTVCRHAGMRTIAEFVEDAQTLAALRSAGVDHAQGFGIARPAPLYGFDAEPAAETQFAVAA